MKKNGGHGEALWAVAISSFALPVTKALNLSDPS
jgi:hypothetical protein